MSGERVMAVAWQAGELLPVRRAGDRQLQRVGRAVRQELPEKARIRLRLGLVRRPNGL